MTHKVFELTRYLLLKHEAQFDTNTFPYVHISNTQMVVWQCSAHTRFPFFPDTAESKVMVMEVVEVAWDANHNHGVWNMSGRASSHLVSSHGVTSSSAVFALASLKTPLRCRDGGGSWIHTLNQHAHTNTHSKKWPHSCTLSYSKRTSRDECGGWRFWERSSDVQGKTETENNILKVKIDFGNKNSI